MESYSSIDIAAHNHTFGLQLMNGKRKDDGTTLIKTVTLVYQLVLIPTILFIALQTYQMNARQAVAEEKGRQNTVNIGVMQGEYKVMWSNQMMLCNYGEPNWPSHSKCIR